MFYLNFIFDTNSTRWKWSMCYITWKNLSMQNAAKDLRNRETVRLLWQHSSECLQSCCVISSQPQYWEPGGLIVPRVSCNTASARVSCNTAPISCLHYAHVTPSRCTHCSLQYQGINVIFSCILSYNWILHYQIWEESLETHVENLCFSIFALVLV